MVFSIDTARQRYHVAKLTLFNVRFLNEVNLSESKDIKSLIQSVADKNGVSMPVSMLNQGTFLSVAYICIVWLWESVKSCDQARNSMLRNLPSVAKRYDVALPSCDKIIGPRRLDDWNQLMRLVRNALSHSRVEIDGEYFILSDQNEHGNNAELEPTQLKLTWAELGGLSEACIHALTPVLYPPLT